MTKTERSLMTTLYIFELETWGFWKDLKPTVLSHNQDNVDEEDEDKEDMNDKDTKDFSINLAARELRCLQEPQHIII